MIDESNKDYVKLAVAKGMKSRDVMNKQIFRNAFVPLIQYIPTSFFIDTGRINLYRVSIFDSRYGWTSCKEHSGSGQYHCPRR